MVAEIVYNAMIVADQKYYEIVKSVTIAHIVIVVITVMIVICVIDA